MRIANVVLNDFTRDNRVLKVSTSLAEAGHEVTVVALHKSGLPLVENHDGWQVSRTALWTARLPRGTVFGAMKMVELALRVVWKWRRVEAWHCNDIEAFVLGWLAQRLNPKLRLIYDCHEFESERNAKPEIERKLVRFLERKLIRRAAAVITVSPSIAQAYEERYAEHGMKSIHLVRNIPEPRTGTGTGTGTGTETGTGTGDRFRERFGIPAGDFVALYQGAFTYNRGLETALEAMEGLNDEGIHLVLMGYGPLQHLVDAASARLPHVHVHPAVAYEEVLEHTRSADVGLVSVRPTCLSYLYCLPNKLFEYTLAGVPVLSNDLPDCAAFIHSYQIGEVVPHDTPEGWRDALRALKSTGTERFQPGLEQAGRELSWHKEAQILIGVYQDLGV